MGLLGAAGVAAPGQPGVRAFSGSPWEDNVEENDQALVELVGEVDKAELLLSQGLLRVDELHDITRRATYAFETAADHDIQYRKYDKARRSATMWVPVRQNGYAEPSDATSLRQLKQAIVELLHLREVEVEPKEVFIAPGEPFTGRVAIRNILSRAQVSIDIKDDYPFSADTHSKNITLLAVMGPYLEGEPGITARLLGSSRQLPDAVLSDVEAFLRQYGPSVRLKGFSHTASGARESHGRFIIVDGKEVFAVDGSVKDLGLTQALISQINDPNVIEQYLRQFEDWWARAVAYRGLHNNA